MAALDTLHGEALRAAVVPWRDEVGKADRNRLDALVRIATSERFKLSECLRTLFPDLSGKKAVAALASFRKRINDAAAAARPVLELRFQVDAQVQGAPEERECWFTGPDPVVAGAIHYSQQVTGDVAGKPLIRPLGIATTGRALAAGKRLVRFFLAYAHADRRLVDSLMAELQKQFSAAARYEYDIWLDGKILVGEKWRASIDRAIRKCEFGLLLVSPAFLGSKYIQDHELSQFVGECVAKPILPVGLAKVDLHYNHDLRGLQEHQLFLKGGGRFFSELQGTKNKADFAFELFTKIQERLDAFFSMVAE